MSIVLTEDRGAVRHIVMNRPEKRNALNRELIEGLADALRAAASDPAVRCVVLRGAGPMFSSGMDFHDLARRVRASASTCAPRARESSQRGTSARR